LKEKIDIDSFKKRTTTQQFNQIVNMYSQDLYWVIRPIVKSHEDTDDVLQNTFIKIYQNLPRFRFESKLFSWMYRIATNEALSYLKSKQRKYNYQNINEVALDSLVSDIYYDGNEMMQQLEKAIVKLPPKQQEIFRLKYFNEMKYEEMSEMLGTSVGGLKASFHLATKKIKTELNLL